MLVVIMAGGVGERFWPESRRQRPKQLLDLTGRGSMIRLTIERIGDLARPDEIFVLTNHEQRAAMLGEVAGLVSADRVIGEPEVRNTAPSIGLAALLARRSLGDRAMLVLPADHLVAPVARFRELARAAARFVETHDALLTFGIRPRRPETGYGYIRRGEAAWRDGDIVVDRVEQFMEKPDAARAAELVDEGCLWNSGMFVWRIETILDRIDRHEPELGATLARIDSALGTEPLDQVLKREYPRAPAISIDYGVMEKADNVFVLPADLDWNDVGSWEFIRDVHPADAHGNVLVGDHLVVDGSNNTLVGSERLIGVVGVDDMVIVDAGDAILVTRRDRVQDVKRIVAELRRRGKNELY